MKYSRLYIMILVCCALMPMAASASIVGKPSLILAQLSIQQQNYVQKLKLIRQQLLDLATEYKTKTGGRQQFVIQKIQLIDNALKNPRTIPAKDLKILYQDAQIVYTTYKKQLQAD